MNLGTPYEALGPDGFQRFCQALLADEYQDLHSVPLYRGDGGRDAFLRTARPADAIVFQCKWVEDGKLPKNKDAWLRELVNTEAPHIYNLADDGVGHYRLLTNAIDDPDPNRGSRARFDHFLQEHLAKQLVRAHGKRILIPDIQIWWRADLDAKLSRHPQLRWEFPQLLTGSHVLQELLESGLAEDALRRSLAIRTFLTHQFDLVQPIES